LFSVVKICIQLCNRIDVAFGMPVDTGFFIHFRLGWAVGCLRFGHASLVNECFTKLCVKYYYTMSLFVMVSSLFLAVLIVRVSLKGTIINAYPRRHMAKLLITKVITHFVDLTIIIYLACWHSETD